jgi:hypothetical protein
MKGNKMEITTNTKVEQSLREIGFTIPIYPSTGDVLFHNEKVGRMSNFYGLILDDCNSTASVLLKSLENKLDLAIWNKDTNE